MLQDEVGDLGQAPLVADAAEANDPVAEPRGVWVHVPSDTRQAFDRALIGGAIRQPRRWLALCECHEPVARANSRMRGI